MRKEYIKGSFAENPYVPGQIVNSDIDVMEMNDSSPKRALRLAKPV